jgi:hypothetical protein
LEDRVDKKYPGGGIEWFSDICRDGDFSSVGPKEFFRLFPGGKTIQTFDDKGHDRSLANIFYFPGEMSALMQKELEKLNKRGAGIFFCVNEADGAGRKVANVTRTRAAFADLDGVSIDVALPYKPTLIVESSPGKYHCYWITTDLPIAAFTELQKNIARIFGSDPKVSDLPRVMRVPGFYHLKGEPFLTKVWGGTGDLMTYRDIVEWFPPEKREQWSTKKYKLYSRGSAGTAGTAGKCNWQYGTSKGDRNAHVIKIIGGMIKRGCDWSYIEEEAFRDGHASEPPLDDREIMAILKSAKRYVRG